jgi:hypothetical protein
LKLDLTAVEEEIDRQDSLSGGNSPDAAVARFELLRPDVPSRSIMRKQDLTGFFEGRLLPGYRERLIICAIGCFVVGVIRFEPDD